MYVRLWRIVLRTAEPIDKYGVDTFTFSKQQSNLNIRSALVFLVKVCLVLAASIVCVQVLWKTTDEISGEHVVI